MSSLKLVSLIECLLLRLVRVIVSCCDFFTLLLLSDDIVVY